MYELEHVLNPDCPPPLTAENSAATSYGTMYK